MSDGLTQWWRVSLPYATYGVKVVDGHVAEAPPIARWMVGRDFYDVTRWVERKGGTAQRLVD